MTLPHGIADYNILEKINETTKSEIYRARKNDTAYIIKILKTASISSSDTALFRHEYEILKGVSLDGIVKIHDLLLHDERIALVLEDFNGISLKEHCAGRPMGITEFLPMAIALCDTLGSLHRLGIIHKDIKPNNILVNRTNNMVKIADFGIAILNARANEEIYNPEIIEGTLLYMSPEQTGRMNRPIDYRTDIYSLGISLHEILCGRPPFIASDPMEIIHAHMAKTPPPPASINRNVPTLLSDIIMKMISKSPEDRYQNCFGLMHDLQECMVMLNTNRKIDSFALGTRDVPIKFTIPRVLIGRENDITRLLESFERAADGGKEIMMVSGHPGVGKSALINEVQTSIVKRRGYFGTGAFDQFKRDVPYSALIQAFIGLVKVIMAEHDEQIKNWKKRLLEALGPNGKILTDVIPTLELIIGPQPAVPELGYEESQNRFRIVFKKFIMVFATKEHPLVLFIDDLQWADSASLNLLESSITDREVCHFFFIGAYRHHETDPAHPLMIMIDGIKKQEIAITATIIEPLDSGSTGTYVAQFLRCTERESAELAQLVQAKTNGNPFFITQFMKTLYDNKYIELSKTGRWEWDIDRIKQMQVTDNVVELLTGNLEQLPDDTLHIIKTCSCIGTSFELDMVARINAISIDGLLKHLAVAGDAGIISYSNDRYTFSHDRIRETAYSLIPNNERAHIHYAIGTYMRDKTPEDKIPETILLIVDQLNRAREIITDPLEQTALASLNLIAIKKAMGSAAFLSSIQYTTIALELLGPEPWHTHYDKTLKLYLAKMICEFALNQLDKAQATGDVVLSQAHTELDKLPVYTNLMIYQTTRDPAKATMLGISVLHKLGYKKITYSSIQINLIREVIQFKMKAARLQPDEVISYPEITDPTMLAVFDIIDKLVVSAMGHHVDFAIRITMHVLNYYFKHHVIESNAAKYFGYAGTVAMHHIKDTVLGKKIFTILNSVNERFPVSQNQPMVHYLIGIYYAFWTMPTGKAITYLRSGYQFSLETGNNYLAGININMVINVLFKMSGTIQEVYDEILKYEDFLIRSQNRQIILAQILFKQLCLNLMGKTEDQYSLSGAGYTQEEFLEEVRKNNFKTLIGAQQMLRCLVLYLYRQYDEALACIDELLVDIAMHTGLPGITSIYHYHNLIMATLYPKAQPKEKKRFLRVLKQNQVMMKNWAENYGPHFSNLYHVVSAEIAAITGDKYQAILWYTTAIAAAREHGYLLDEAMTHERAARFFLANGIEDIATGSILQSHACYMRWGAAAKARDLQKEFTSHFAKALRRKDSPSTAISGDTLTRDTLSSSTTTLSQSLDISTVFKASQTISGEVILASLLSKLLTIAIENAGAQRGMLIMDNKGKLDIVAQHEIDGASEQITDHVPIDSSDAVSAAIVYYTARSKEVLILNDAVHAGQFITDPYIVQQRPKSILCLPIINQGKVNGILYLENNSTIGAFTPERVEVLKILSSQAAISIDNASLYANLEEKVRERTLELEQARDEIWGEMQLAKKIQTALLPKAPRIMGYEIIGYMEPADEVGGDYYDIINGKDCDWVVIGDVSGHGVPAGLIMMMAQTTIQAVIREHLDIKPSDLLRIVNRVIYYNLANLGESKYMTLTILMIDKQGRVLHAGLHQDIMIYRAAQGRVEEIETKGIWMGILDSVDDMNHNHEFTLEPGDVMLLYTDGITEAEYLDDIRFGQEKLAELLTRTGQTPLEEIQKTIRDEIRGYRISDDITLLIVKRIT